MTGKAGRNGNDARASKPIDEKQEIGRAPRDGTSSQSLPSNLKLFAATQVKKELLFCRADIDTKTLSGVVVRNSPSIVGACSCKHHCIREKFSTTKSG